LRRPFSCLADKRIGGGSRIGVSAVRVNPQNFSEQDVQVLRIVVRIARIATIAGRYVKIVVLPEGEHATLVILEGL
jgi:hypothetical protein